MTLTDIYFILFRHKWKILVCTLIGFLAAGVMFATKTVLYLSEARIFIRFVQEKTTVTPLAQGERISRGDQRSETIVLTETEILSSQDVAESVAKAVGPARILAAYGGGTDAEFARAGSILRQHLLIVAPGRTSVLHLQFKHPDAQVVQPVLSELIKAYLKKHTEIHRSVGIYDEFLNAETDTRHARLVQTEEELRKLLEQAGVQSIEEARLSYSTQSASIRQNLMTAEAELAENRAALAEYVGEPRDTTASTTPSDQSTASEQPAGEPPSETVDVYRAVVARLATLRAREQQLLLQFTPETPMVKGIRAQIQESDETRARLEREYPSLVSQRPVVAATNGGTREGTVDIPALRARIRAIESRSGVLRNQLENLRNEAAALGKYESSISELKRQRDIVEQQYRAFAMNREQTRIDEALSTNHASNISVVQEPSPPARDLGTIYTLVGGLAFGGIALGFGLAFAIEFYFDQSVRRPSEIEKGMKVPLMISIPRVSQKELKQATSPRATLTAGDPKKSGDSGAIVPATSPAGSLNRFIEALRDRLVYNFEMRNVTRKPKLVGVTSCNGQSGVSTIAAGLAATLSETGDGNVLLVDMNPDRAAPQYFQKGQLQVGLTDVLEQEKRDDALVSENLYRVSQNSSEDRFSWVIPKRFATLVPKMKASDFDYIIFDMPPVSQISATPQLARFMDSVLLVVESEKTNRDSAKRAAQELQEAGANVSVVLNKTTDYVPKALSPAV